MLQHPTKEKYSIETLKELNASYDYDHKLTREDVDMANNYVELIELTRSIATPQIGDRVVYVTKDGDYYGDALIENHHFKEGHFSVCERPYIPFVWQQDGGIRLSVSGGAFHAVDAKEMKFLRWTEGEFCDWGHCGACKNGAVSFMAKVPLWYYAEPNPKYGDFTTETYRKLYLSKADGQYKGYEKSFNNEDEFRKFLSDFEGKVFEGNWANQIVIWCFREESIRLPLEEWEKIDTPSVTRKINGRESEVKIVKDMVNHVSYFFRIKKD